MLFDPMIYFNKEENEVWKPLIFEGIKTGEYLISNFGNIYDVVKQKYVTPIPDKNTGYVRVCLRTISPDYNHSLLLHRVVAENFIGEKEVEQTQVNHINGVKSNNRDINLEWSTPKENTRHAFDTGLAINNIGERSHLAKLSDNQVKDICKLLSEGKRYKEILDIIGLENNDNNRDMIGNIYRRISWTHISKDYTFPEYDNRFRTNSKETIHSICKAIEDGLNNAAVHNKIFGNIPNPSVNDKNNYELIRLIRKKEIFKDISQSYKF